ncbi:MAG: FtsH protease activity modulator HflK [Planctomycetes bacterium]|nr:FtsH protease activity modulator HflK [Planctomycetota bacterium]
MNRKQQTLLITIGANGLLIVLRFILAFVSGSLALKANAWHSLADLVVLGIVFLGFIIAAQQDERFKGLIARTENIVAIIVALFIFYMGFDLFYEAISGEAVELEYLVWAALGAFFGVCITYFMGQYMLYVGRQENSPSLIAAGYHARMDMLCSSAVLVGLVGSIFGMTGLDKVAATIVVIFIFLAAFEIFLTNLNALRSGKGVPPDHAHEHGLSRSGRAVAAGIILFCVIGYLASGLYFVRPDEQAVVRRLGTVLNEPVGPGLHYRWPYPLERVNVVRVSKIREIDTPKKLMLTGDENLVQVSVAVHFRVTDAVRFLLYAADPERVVKNAAASSVRSMVGRSEIDVLLTTGRDMMREETRKALQEELDRNKVGLEVTDVLILDIAPPEDVKDAFQDVASAREDRVTYINEAYSFRNALVPTARGEAAERLRSSEAYKIEKLDKAQGEAARFTKKVEEYAKARDVTQTRLYLEAMEKVLPGARKFLIGSGVQTDGTDLWFLAPGAETPFTQK